MREARNRVAANCFEPLENAVSSYVLEQEIDWARGYVHSVFRTSLNVEVNGFLLHIGGASSPLSCCGANVPADVLEAALARSRTGDRAIVRQGVLSVYDIEGVWSIDLHELEVKSLSVASPIAFGRLAALERELDELGLEGRIGLARDDRFDEVVRLLERSEPCDEEYQAAIGFLLGRGLGLTPSGDDVLVGYGIALWMQGRARRFARVLDGMLKGQTTDVSASYLRAMVAGHANQGYCELGEAAAAGESARVSQALAGLQRVGHTSGNDGLFGFAVGLRSGALA